MKSLKMSALLLIVAESVFGTGPQTVGLSHANSGYDHKDVVIAVMVSPAEKGRLWLNASHSYQLLLSETEKLLSLVKAVAKKIDIAIANKSTISYQQDVGMFYTDSSALIAVAFATDGYRSSYTVVRIMNAGNNDILLLSNIDTRAFVNLLENAQGVVDDYRREAALFN